MSLQYCYNKGCGQKFDPAENHNDACTYHPGPPFFHDAYKGWACCNKKVTDFTEFLNIKGCAKGEHNSTKPAEPEKPKVEKSDEVITCVAPKARVPVMAERPSVDEALRRLDVTVSSSLQQLLSAPKITAPSDTDSKAGVGESCKNNACKATFNGTNSEEVCVYHPGVPIFHEGMKYWSCCQKKTSDFDAFLNQGGCTKGEHCWTKEASSEKTVETCRYDWHQTSSFVIVTIYAKACLPDQSFAEANTVQLKVHLEFNRGASIFNLDVPLWGAIDVAGSSVTLAGTKAEIKMKKVEPFSWSRLQYIAPPTSEAPSE